MTPLTAKEAAAEAYKIWSFHTYPGSPPLPLTWAEVELYAGETA